MQSKATLSIELWNRKDLERDFLAAAQLRMQVFRDFPYLYEGSVEYEQEYLSIYLKSDRSFFVAVKDQGKLVGLSSALPLNHENDYIQKPFVQAGMDINKIFYFGESVLLSQYRGLGVGNAFFTEREKAALSYGEYSITCFCAVDRPQDHPLRPAGYKPLHDFWKKRGYNIRTDLQAQFSWKDINESEESSKSMTYWLREWR